ncbi:MAG: hypothetical protein NTW09_02545 [Candidatus Omnitrophica bacterium]|nr:hypothetical protein [Candidatus Omnitrophota bacterium]
MKQEIYKWIRMGGLLSFIPFVLAAGPIAGYLAGEYLIKRFGLPQYISYIFAAVGFAASARETVRIIRIAIKTDKEF